MKLGFQFAHLRMGSSLGETSIEGVRRYLIAHGTVQKVMFRQTCIRKALMLRGPVKAEAGVSHLRCGATNDSRDRTRVDITLDGPEHLCDEFVAWVGSGELLNSWGARVDRVDIVDTGHDIGRHQVTTENVHTRRWDPNVEFYF
mmetsp:Transcript_10893/g.21772  ORF Transcript_10893/g.21772 Transcript_10893/m.21772 type:complete len:144 (+) Transcript_10893:1256-1687(+)